MKKKTEVTAQTRHHLINAFWQLYCKKDIHNYSARKTEKAGYNRRTFYEYFLDVRDLLDQVEDSLVNDVVAKTQLFSAYAVSYSHTLMSKQQSQQVGTKHTSK